MTTTVRFVDPQGGTTQSLATDHVPSHLDWVSAPGLGRGGYAYQVQSIGVNYSANGDAAVVVHLSEDSRRV